jgi:hypothetical protein
VSQAVALRELVLADEPARWEALGFAVRDGRAQLGGVQLHFAGAAAGRGIVGWSLPGLVATELDGLPPGRPEHALRESESESAPRDPEPSEPERAHPNGALAVDHVVAMSPALDRTVLALQAAGLQLRRIRELPTPAGAPRQAFFRLGPAILEVVQEPPDVVACGGGPERPARLWGLALTVADLDRAGEVMAPQLGSIRPAVQPGRQIATVRRSAGLAVPVALMSARADTGTR